MLALLKNEIQVFPIGLAAVGTNLRDGKLTALAVATRERVPMLPEVPTIAESGYPDFAVSNWFGLAAPARDADPVLDMLSASVARARQTDLVGTVHQARHAGAAAFPGAVCGEFEDRGRVLARDRATRQNCIE